MQLIFLPIFRHEKSCEPALPTFPLNLWTFLLNKQYNNNLLMNFRKKHEIIYIQIEGDTVSVRNVKNGL